MLIPALQLLLQNWLASYQNAGSLNLCLSIKLCRQTLAQETIHVFHKLKEIILMCRKCGDNMTVVKLAVLLV